MDQEKLKSILESLLFVSGDPLPFSRLAAVIEEAEKKEIRAALDDLKAEYETHDRGFRLTEVAGGYQLQTPRDNAQWVGRLMNVRPVRLTRPSLETLAIIAYRQPVTRAEIEEFRGVDSGGVLKTLLDNDFIRIVGRKDLPGKPIIYATTPRFMEFFRLKTLADLPTLKEMEDLTEENAEAMEIEQARLEETEEQISREEGAQDEPVQEEETPDQEQASDEEQTEEEPEEESEVEDLAEDEEE